ncbi:hypothetical protein [uncultured Mucilaginibacter sp.]|uniref:hypothetical protein n=1 Tax=uncultured Mucilaginibacter sp. TaxID=797541 RepID=UPI0025CE2221|nr:hypothetical protein [uncultured Mucilaginibacter sp.]
METQRTITIFSGPVTAVVIVLLLAGNIFFYLRSGTGGKPDDTSSMPLPKYDEQSAAISPPSFNTDDRAIFEFTKDTVLVLAPAHPINANPAWNILYKDKYGIYQNEDVPEDMLDKIEQDTK